MALIRMTWNEFDTVSSTINDYIDSLGEEIDAIVGIARAGLPLMVTLAIRRRVRDTGVVFVRRTMTEEPFSPFYPSPIVSGCAWSRSLDGLRVVVADNVVHSGETARVAIRLVNEHGGSVLTVVGLARYRDSYEFHCFAPIRLREEDWVSWPWDAPA